MKHTGLLGLTLALLLASICAAMAQEKPVSPEALTQAIAQRTAQLGVCHAELGQLQQLQASVIAGQLVEPSKALADLKAKIAAANPGKVLDDTFHLVDAPKAEKK